MKTNGMQVGKVILAGAGPGDPELITLKTLKYLKTADVILTDRLVSPEIIEDYAHPKANVIYVGKQCSKGIHTPQEEINDLLVSYAKQGLLVLRLKGGDASLFSNILDELEVLTKNRIPYEIIPGITAAFGASAYAGIPLTARGYSRGVRLLTLYDLDSITDDTWVDWSKTSDTLVFYMSGQKVIELYNRLQSLNIDKSKSLAIIEQVTTKDQKTTIFNFYEKDGVEKYTFKYVPTLIIIGEVVNLHQQYGWIPETNEETNSYFDQHKINMAYAV